MHWYEYEVMGPYGKMKINKERKMKITKERKKARKIRAKQARLDGLKQYWRRKKFGTVPAMEGVDAGKDSPLVCSEAQAPGVDKKGSNMSMGEEGDCEKKIKVVLEKIRLTSLEEEEEEEEEKLVPTLDPEEEEEEEEEEKGMCIQS